MGLDPDIAVNSMNSTDPAKMSLNRIPTPPRSLSAHARELVFRYHGSHKSVLYLGFQFILLGLPVAVAANWKLPADIAIDVAGSEVTAQVLGVEPVLKGRDRGEGTRVQYRYEVNGTEYVEDQLTLNRDVVRAALPGQSVSAEVAASHPTWVRLKGSTSSWFGYWGCIAIVIPPIGLALIAFAMLRKRRQIRTFEHGTPIAARITFSDFDLGTTINRRHPYKVAWEFVAADGKRYAGSIQHMDPAALKDISGRTEAIVLYDPLDPSSNVPYVE